MPIEIGLLVLGRSEEGQAKAANTLKNNDVVAVHRVADAAVCLGEHYRLVEFVKLRGELVHPCLVIAELEHNSGQAHGAKI